MLCNLIRLHAPCGIHSGQEWGAGLAVQHGGMYVHAEPFASVYTWYI